MRRLVLLALVCSCSLNTDELRGQRQADGLDGGPDDANAAGEGGSSDEGGMGGTNEGTGGVAPTGGVVMGGSAGTGGGAVMGGAGGDLMGGTGGTLMGGAGGGRPPGAACSQPVECASGVCIGTPGRCCDRACNACGESCGTGYCEIVTKVESCNNVDDNCDGKVDNGADCGGLLLERLGHRYILRTAADARARWDAAGAACNAVGYKLVTIEDEAENQWLFTELTKLPLVQPAPRDIGVWLGLTDLGAEATWVWSSGSASAYRRWGNGAPDNGKWVQTDGTIIDMGEEDCAVMRVVFDPVPSHASMWGDSACAAMNRYVCEAP